MNRRLKLAFWSLWLATGCTFHGPREIEINVLIPPVAGHRAIPDYRCVFVNVMGATLADKSSQCWTRAQVSGAVWRGGSSTAITVPMSVVPGKNQTIKVFSLEGGDINSMNCHGPIDDLLKKGAKVYQYASTTADIFAGATVDVYPASGVQSGGELSACASGPRTLLTTKIMPAPEVPLNRQRKMHLVLSYSDGTTEDVTAQTTWSASVLSGTSINTTTGVLTAGSTTGALTVTATYQGNNYQRSGNVIEAPLLFGDSGNNQVRRVTFSGLIPQNSFFFAGRPQVAGNAGDGGPALQARLNSIDGIVSDDFGNVYLSDATSNVVRLVDATYGNIQTVAGGGLDSSTEGIDATDAFLSSPHGLALVNGDLVIAVTGQHKVRNVSNGVITTVFGNGSPGSTVSGSNGTSSNAHGPWGLAYDGTAYLFISESSGHRIDKVNVNSSYGGNPHAGDGIPGWINSTNLSARFDSPRGIAIGPSGLYVADYANRVVRLVGSSTTSTPIGVVPCGGAWRDGSSVFACLGNVTDVSYLSGVVFFSDSLFHAIAYESGGYLHLVAGNGDTVTDVGTSGITNNGDPSVSHGVNTPLALGEYK